MNDKQTLKINLQKAINASLLYCVSFEELTLAGDIIAEFLSATSLDNQDCVEVLSNCGGFDVDSDDLLDKLIEGFSDESL